MGFAAGVPESSEWHLSPIVTTWSNMVALAVCHHLAVRCLTSNIHTLAAKITEKLCFRTSVLGIETSFKYQNLISFLIT